MQPVIKTKQMEPISLPALKRELIDVSYFQPQVFLDSTAQGQVGTLLIESYSRG